jgi:hypothetical protein
VAAATAVAAEAVLAAVAAAETDPGSSNKNRFKKDTMQRNPRVTVITLAAASLILGSLGLSFAQETSESTQRRQQQQQTRAGKDLTQGSLSGRTTAARPRLGICDGTRQGSPGRLGVGRNRGSITSGMSTSSNASNRRAKRSPYEAGRIGNRNAGTMAQHSSVRTRARARNLSGTGSGPCAGARIGSRQRAGRSGVGRRR